jgi:hypothetical protein
VIAVLAGVVACCTFGSLFESRFLLSLRRFLLLFFFVPAARFLYPSARWSCSHHHTIALPGRDRRPCAATLERKATLPRGEGCKEAASTARALPRTLQQLLPFQLEGLPSHRRRRRIRRLHRTRILAAACACPAVGPTANRRPPWSTPHTTPCDHCCCSSRRQVLQRVRSGCRSGSTLRRADA